MSVSTMPPSVVYAAIEGERSRLRELFAHVYRPDGSIDEDALARFQRALMGPGQVPTCR